MPGPAPADPRKRQRRNKTTTAATLEALPAKYEALPAIRWSAIKCAFLQELSGAPPLRCPLPKWRHNRTWFERLEADAEEANEPALEAHDFDPVELPWRPTTLAWWAVIWASPMAEEWVQADVPGLFALALLIDDFWTGPDSKIHAEIRQASREFGLSPFSRRQLQWEIKRLTGARPGQPEKPADAKPVKGGLLGVLEGGKATSTTSRRRAAK